MTGSYRAAPAVAWVPTAAALYDVPLDRLALLDPHDGERRGRWLDALAEAAAAPHEDELGPEPGSARDVVASVGSPEPAAWRFAQTTGRRFETVETVHDAVGLVERGDLRSLTLCGNRRAFRADGLGALAAAALASGVLAGVMTGSDAASLSFVCAKAARRRMPAVFRCAYLDAVYEKTEPIDVARAVDEPLELLVLCAHGEGAHLNLQHRVLCGSVTAETDVAGRAVGGCTPDRCKRASSVAAPASSAMRVRAGMLALLSCNAFSVAGELFDSNNSILLALADGTASAVLAAFRSAVIGQSTGYLVRDLLAAGEPLGSVANTLNDLSLRSGEPPAFAVFGDPLAGAAVPARAPEWTRIAAAGRGAVHEIVRPNGERCAPFVGVRELIVPRGSRVVDRTADTASATAGLARRRAAVERADAVERALRALHPDAIASSRRARGAAFELAALRGSAERTVWQGLRLSAQAERSGAWSTAIEPSLAAIDAAMSAWDALLAELLGGGELQYALPDALHLDHARGDGTAGPRCGRCGSRTFETILHALDGCSGTRRLVDCPVCGPIAEHAVGGPALSLSRRGPCRRGEPLVVDVRWQVPERCVLDAGYLATEFRDKATGRVVSASCDRVAVAEGARAVTVPVPPDAGADIHTLRAVFCTAMDQSFARLRVPLSA